MNDFSAPGAVARPSWRVANLSSLLEVTSRRLPDAPALIRGDTTLSWRDLQARVEALAAGLLALGVGKGDRVLLHARNGFAMVEVMFACFRIGAVYAPTNFRLTPSEVIWLAQMSQARVFICDSAFPDHAAQVAAAHGPRHVLRIGDGGFGDADTDGVIAAHAGAQVPACAVSHDDPCWFFFTSGTTGRSKAAVLTHGQLGFVVTNHIADLMPGLCSEDASLVVAPLSHGAGVHLLAQVARAVRSVLMPDDRFDVPTAWALIARHRISNMFTVPTILTMLTDHPAAAAADTSSLRHVIYAGAPMYRADQRAILARLGKVIVQYFGLGEVTGCITVLPAPDHEPDDATAQHIGSCGYPRTGIDVSIQDDNGTLLPPGETGEVCAIGPAVFAGYHDNPEANAKAFRDGWFRTGDLGHMDARGFVHITGRASDMYISGGSNVYPREIEEVLLTHPDIAEAAVLGVPDPKWGESGIAICVARPGAHPEPEAILDWLAARLARYKQPRQLLFWDALPKSGYGKVPKRMLQAELEARGLWPIPAPG